MRLIQYLPSFNQQANHSTERGFTLLEVLVAMGLSSIIFAMLGQTLVSHSDHYLEDIARTKIQQNLRGALDIISTNIRQAGESLDQSFPAVVLQGGSMGNPDTLTLRRNLLSGNLLLCQPVLAGTDRLYVTDVSSGESECIPANVVGGISRFVNFRTSRAEPVPLYIYNRVSEVGEFVEYTGEGVVSGDSYLEINDLDNDYPQGSTSIYILEEFRFNLFSMNNTLELNLDGETASPQDVAYEIADFQVEFDMNDGSTVHSFGASDILNWKDIQTVRVAITGEDNWKNRTFTRTVTGEYFPRNVISR